MNSAVPLTPLDRQRWQLVLGTMALGMTLILLAAKFHLGWKIAALSALLINALLLWHALARKDALFLKLFVFGLVAGIAELPSDWFSVSVKGVLSYPGGEPMVWTSPLYMPLGYSVLLVQFGWVGWRTLHRFGLAKSVLITGVAGGAMVPVYEYLAHSANYWTYQNTAMLFNTVPYYIPAGELVFMAAVPFMLRKLDRGGLGTATVLGIVEGAIMFVAWWASFQLLQ
jgi:hypothetical protein